jgi:enhancing lycopene biosynthesis protein 2
MQIYELALNADIDAIRTLRESQNDSGDVCITIAALQSVFERYVAGQISSSHLEEWANLLLFYDSFHTKCYIDDAVDDAMDWLWDIMHEIASPETEGEFTFDKARSYLTFLSLKSM